MALAVESRAEDLEEAVYYSMAALETKFSQSNCLPAESIQTLNAEGVCREGSGEHGVAETTWQEAVSRKETGSYQSSGVGAINTEQGNRGAGFLGRGGIGAQAVEGRTGHGELLGGAEAGTGDASGHHRGIG